MDTCDDETRHLLSSDDDDDEDKQICPICLWDTTCCYVLSDDNFQKDIFHWLTIDDSHSLVCIPSCTHAIHFNCLLNFIDNHIEKNKENYERIALQYINSNAMHCKYPDIDFELTCPCCRVNLISENNFIKEITNTCIQVYTDKFVSTQLKTAIEPTTNNSFRSGLCQCNGIRCVDRMCFCYMSTITSMFCCCLMHCA